MNASNNKSTKNPKSVLPADERIWPLKPEVLLARGKCEIQGKEEKAIRGAIKEAIATYRQEAQSLLENNWENRQRIAQLLTQSSEEAEEILIRRCTYDQAKYLKYRGKDAEDVSGNIDEEIAFLQNVLNDLSNRRKQRTQTLLNQQRVLATMQVNQEMEDEQFPEEEQRIRCLQCEIEKVDQKMSAAVTFRDKYQDFISKLSKEKMFYEARLNKLQKCIEQDIYDLETCHDILMKGSILEHDAAEKMNEEQTTYVAEKKEREEDIKNMRKEVLRKADHTNRKKVTLGEVDLDKVLKEHQNIFSQIQERRKTMVELDNWVGDFEQLQAVTRAPDLEGVTQQFEKQMGRHTYLNRERERVETLRQSQLQQLAQAETVLSSVLHTGAEAMQAVDKQVEELEKRLSEQRARRELAEGRLRTVGAWLSSARGSVRQQLRSLRFVSRPQGWTRKPSQTESVGDLELLRLKMISLQQRYEALGAPLRLSSQASVRSDALAVPKSQFRVNKMSHAPLLGVEMGKVDDMHGMRNEMKKLADDFVVKMTTKGRRPPK